MHFIETVTKSIDEIRQKIYVTTIFRFYDIIPHVKNIKYLYMNLFSPTTIAIF